MKKNNSNMITLKLSYQTESSDDTDRIFQYIKNYMNVLRFTYNRVEDAKGKISTKELTEKQRLMNNIFVNSHLKNSANFQAKAMYSSLNTTKGEKIYFGGKFNFFHRLGTNSLIDKEHKKISHEEFVKNKENKYKLYSVGESLQKANRLFSIINNNTILFKPSKLEHFNLHLQHVGKNYKRYLDKLIPLQNTKAVSITYELSRDYVYLTFDLNCFGINKQETIQDRIFAIDLNPNYIGYSIIDWKNNEDFNLVDKGLISIKSLNDKENKLIKELNLQSDNKIRIQLNNKRQYETIKIAHNLIRIAQHYKCDIFSIEDLSIKSKDNERGKKYNKLVNNNWCRDLIYKQIKKECYKNNINLLEVSPNYSSFLGNLVYRYLRLPDPVLASIEINRRGREFYHQYIIKDEDVKKNIVINNSDTVKSRIAQSLEELNYKTTNSENIVKLYYQIKKSKLKYRFQLENLIPDAVFSKFSKKSHICYYTFI